jgi:hypothetical protein
MKSALPSSVTERQTYTHMCLARIMAAKREMKCELESQSKAKVAYQYDLATGMIDRKNSHLGGFNALSEKLQRED